MMITRLWLNGLLRRRRGRIVASTVGVAIAVALLATVGAFLSTSKSTMTKRAAATVATDWQVEVSPKAEVPKVLAELNTFPGLRNITEVLKAETEGFSLTKDGSTQTTGAGVVLGIPDSYRTAFPDAIRTLAGADTGVLIAQQTAANLHAAVGDSITVQRSALPLVTVTIAGVIDMLSADSLFQKIGAPAGSQPSAPPDNVIVIPPSTWHKLFDSYSVVRPEAVSTQFHVDYASKLPDDPAAAYSSVIRQQQNLELRLAGSGLVGNNLGAQLAKTRSDALYAQVLFLFLGAPGAVIAALMTATVAAAGADRRRRDQALLRLRGATSRQLVNLGIAEAACVAIVGAALGLLLARIVSALAFKEVGGTFSFGLWSVVAVVVGALVAVLAIALPSYNDAHSVSVMAARRIIGRDRNPRWMRWKIDFIFLAAAWLVYWLTSRNGFHLVLAVEGVPSISVNYWAFAAPAFAWIGAALMAWRLAVTILSHGQSALRVVIRPLSRGLASTVVATMGRQRRLLARGLTLVALTTAFAASTSVFNATYNQQAEVDAVLSNGAMVTVHEPPGVNVAPTEAKRLSKIPGVRSVTAVQHRYAYVGADLQDVYGIDPTTIVKSTKLRDAYFEGGTAAELMAKLKSQPNSVLVSAETAKDFQLTQGDTLRLRLQNGKTKRYVTVPFIYVGVTKEFPTAPSDSFLIANAAYIAKTTGTNTVGTFLLDTRPSESTVVTHRVQEALGTGAIVNDIASSRRKVGSSLTAVELGGLTHVELGFALVLAAAAAGLVLWLGLAERRRTFAIATALGANQRQLGGFIWAESAFTTIGGLGLGAAIGWGLTNMLIKILTHVFDPPPSALSVPWGYLWTVAVLTAAAVVVTSITSIRATRKPAIVMLRDL